ncbi:hypothetical protein GDO81_025939 [Engystomops pustulosus]|uniref:Taste receptor type 2 n=1 Tax=Engystomops pustulosus TaxID=76066 RepID=A0AAV6ZG57_ENGPU|nr:hypothetical protein GDO81_025939 [Engystomops pustulosus]
METQDLLLFLVFTSFLSSGIYLSLFISVVSYRTWLSDGSHQPQGLLLFSIGLSSAIFDSYQLSIDVSSLFWTEALSSLNVCLVFIRCLFTSCIFFNMCQISWLCSFYCIKLVSFHHWIIRVLKSRFPSILRWIMAGALLLSILVLVLMFGVLYISVPADDINNGTFCRRINVTYVKHIRFMKNGMSFIVALPFCLILVSLSCTAITLMQHVRRVQGTLHLDRSHLEAHIDAAKTMILLLTLNTSFYVSLLFLNWDVLPSPWSWICIVIYYLFWPLQALTLIFRTKKLHRSFIQCPPRWSSEKMGS